MEQKSLEKSSGIPCPGARGGAEGTCCTATFEAVLPAQGRATHRASLRVIERHTAVPIRCSFNGKMTFVVPECRTDADGGSGDGQM